MKTAIQAFEPAYRPAVSKPANDRVTLAVVETSRRTRPQLTFPKVDARLFHAWRP